MIIIISSIIIVIIALLVRKGNVKPHQNANYTPDYTPKPRVKPNLLAITPKLDTHTHIPQIKKETAIFIPPNPIKLPEETGEYLKDKEVNIEYHDRNETQTKRKIIIENIYFNGGQYPDSLSAFCLLRKERRTFHFDRIGKVICSDTGVLYDDFYKYAIETIPSHPKYKFLTVINNMKDELNVFVFASKSDGYLRKKEREIITEYLTNYSDYPLELIDNEVKMLECSQHHFTRSLNKVVQKDSEHRKKVAEFAHRIIHSEKNITPIELEVLNKINSKLTS